MRVLEYTLAVLFGVILSACSPRYDYLDVQGLSTPPVPVTLTPSFEVPHGVAVLIEVEPISRNNNPYDLTARVVLRSQDASVFDVSLASDDRTYLLLGKSPGTTCVDVEVDHANQECIPAIVTAEPTSGGG